MLRRILLILLCVSMTFSMMACGEKNNTMETVNKPTVDSTENTEDKDDTTTDSTDETETPDESKKQDGELNDNGDKPKNPFESIFLGVDGLNEDYFIEAKSKDGIWSGIFGRVIGGDLVTLLNSKSDWGDEYSASYDLKYGLPKDIVFSIAPQVALQIVENPEENYHAKYLNVREFNINYCHMYLKVGSNCFEEILVDYRNDMTIKGNVGNFVFVQSPGDGLIADGYYPGGYYMVQIYATTVDEADIHFHFNNETQTFSVDSTSEITNITVSVVADDNEDIVTAVDSSIKGKAIEFIITEDFEANIKIVE